MSETKREIRKYNTDAAMELLSQKMRDGAKI
jgi:hypothetical protein